MVVKIMRIVIDARKYFDFGIGTYIQNLVSHIVDANDVILLITQKDEKRLNSLSNIKKKVNSSKKYSIGELFSLAIDANKLEADIYHSPHYTTPYGLKMPCVTTIHDILHISGTRYYSLPERLYAKIIVSHACNVSDAIIVDSEFTKRELLSYFPKVESRIHVVHLGISHQYFEKHQNEELVSFKNKYGILRSVILYTGNIKPHKNVNTLIKAFSEIKEKKNIQLAFVGQSVYSDKSLRSLIREKRLEEYILELGQISRRELALAYKAASVVVLPSFYEGFGFSVLEAMASGTPAIGANAASIPEVMGEGGVLFNPNSVEELTVALEKVLYDSDLRRKMIQKGYENVKRFSWEKCAEKTFEIYKSII